MSQIVISFLHGNLFSLRRSFDTFYGMNSDLVVHNHYKMPIAKYDTVEQVYIIWYYFSNINIYTILVLLTRTIGAISERFVLRISRIFTAGLQISRLLYTTSIAQHNSV